MTINVKVAQQPLELAEVAFVHLAARWGPIAPKGPTSSPGGPGRKFLALPGAARAGRAPRESLARGPKLRNQWGGELLN